MLVENASIRDLIILIADNIRTLDRLIKDMAIYLIQQLLPFLSASFVNLWVCPFKCFYFKVRSLNLICISYILCSLFSSSWASFFRINSASSQHLGNYLSLSLFFFFVYLFFQIIYLFFSFLPSPSFTITNSVNHMHLKMTIFNAALYYSTDGHSQIVTSIS